MAAASSMSKTLCTLGPHPHRGRSKFAPPRHTPQDPPILRDHYNGLVYPAGLILSLGASGWDREILDDVEVVPTYFQVVQTNFRVVPTNFRVEPTNFKVEPTNLRVVPTN